MPGVETVKTSSKIHRTRKIFMPYVSWKKQAFPVIYSFISTPLWKGYSRSAGWCNFLRVGRCIYLHVVLGSAAAVEKLPRQVLVDCNDL